MRLSLRPCPFCGECPTAQPWHGGAPTKIMIGCDGGEYEDCDVRPMVTGETTEEATKAWNRRKQPSGFVFLEVEVTP